MTLAVITRVPNPREDPEATGNLSHGVAIFVESFSSDDDRTSFVTPFMDVLEHMLDDAPGWFKPRLRDFIFMMAPVFSLGEILVLDGNGRTVPDGRKPDKWDVEYEYCETLEEAVKRSREATNVT